MGLLSWLYEKGLDALDWVQDRVDNVFDFIEDRMDDIEGLFSGKRTKLGKTSKKSAKTISKSKSYNKKTATIEETKAVSKMLEGIRDDYKVTLYDIEKNTIECSEDIIKKVIDMIDTDLNQKSEYDPSISPFLQIDALEKEFNKKNKKFEAPDINVGEIESKFREAIMSFKRTFSSEILDHIAISDSRCSEILKKEKGKRKEEEIKSYLDELVDNALDNFCFNIDEITKNSLNSIKRNINRVMKNNEESIENVKKEIEKNMKLSESEIETKRKEYDRKEKIINNLFETIKL